MKQQLLGTQLTSGSKSWLPKKLAPQKSRKSNTRPKTCQTNTDFEMIHGRVLVTGCFSRY